MVDLKNLLEHLYKRWSSLRRLGNYGSDRYLDLVMICAAIRPIPGPEPWKRHCLALYRLLGIYQLMVSLARVGFSIYNQDDLIALCASIVISVVQIICLVKIYILERYRKVVQQSKVFLDSNFAHSDDSCYDASVRRDSAMVAGRITLVIFLLFCCDQVTVMVPNSARDLIYGLPKQFRLLGPMATRFLQEVYVFLIVILWGNIYFCYSLTVMPLLLGLKSELKIVARGFETIQNRVQVQISEHHKNTVKTSWKLFPLAMRWELLKHILEPTLEQHIDVLRNIQLVKNLITVLYTITYFSSMLIIAICVILAIKNGMTLISLAVLTASCAFLMECYFWSYLIEWIEEIMDLIAASAAQLGTALVHSSEHHSEYIQMRTSLMIIQLQASRRGWFSCGGIFPISVESVGNLCMMIYRFATFLLNFD